MRKKKLYCYGDSNTYGFDPRCLLGGRYEKKDRWCEILADLTGCDVENHGENGRTIPQTDWERRSLLQLDRNLAPGDRVILLLGTNDLLLGADPAETTRRMETLLQSLTHREQVLLLSPPPVAVGGLEEAVRQTERLYEALARRLSVAFAATGPWQPALSCDGVHLSEAGHGTLARQLAAILKKAADSTLA